MRARQRLIPRKERVLENEENPGPEPFAGLMVMPGLGQQEQGGRQGLGKTRPSRSKGHTIVALSTMQTGAMDRPLPHPTPESLPHLVSVPRPCLTAPSRWPHMVSETVVHGHTGSRLSRKRPAAMSPKTQIRWLL